MKLDCTKIVITQEIKCIIAAFHVTSVPWHGTITQETFPQSVEIHI